MSVAAVRRVELEADLRLGLGPHDVAQVSARGADLQVDVTRSGLRTLTLALGGPLGAMGRLSRSAPLLARSGLRMDVRVDGRPVAAAGRGVRPLGRRLGLAGGPFSIRPLNLLRFALLAAFRR